MVNIKRLNQELKNIPKDFIVLVETSADNISETTLEVVKFLTKQNDYGIIVSANRPYINLIANYQRNKIDTNKVYILDLISRNQNADEPADNVMFIKNASSLTDISLSINEHIKRLEGKKFVFIDSITTMLIHNEPYVFARFMHSIFTRMRLNGIGGIMISMTDRTNREVRAEIAQLCDKVIKIE